MEVVRIGALNPPEKNRSAWARDKLAEALSLSLQPTQVPIANIVSFSATLPTHISAQLQSLAKKHNISPARLTAGLIAALEQSSKANLGTEKPNSNSSPADQICGAERVRDVLLPLLTEAASQMNKGKIVFAEAATGTGKGRMIASLAADALNRKGDVVVSAPLNVAWQLVDELMEIPEAKDAGISVALGRNNFISPERAQDWAIEVGNEALFDWISGGGKPISERSSRNHCNLLTDLCWLIDDALVLAEDMPVDLVSLSAEEPEDCPATAQYQANKVLAKSGRITICSHHMLAAHARLLQVTKAPTQHDEFDLHDRIALPNVIGTLIIDEAHQLEVAFAAINSNTIRLRPLRHTIEKHIKTGRKQALSAIDRLTSAIQQACRNSNRKTISQPLADEDPELAAAIKETEQALLAINKKNTALAAKAILNVAIKACRDAGSGYSKLILDLSPKREYPMLISGRASLQKAFEAVWKRTNTAALVSATLYTSGTEGGVMRWKVEAPKERCAFLRPVHPAWIYSTVELRSEACTLAPDDSKEWIEESARIIADACETSKGGTLVLCTSYANISALNEALTHILGERLIAQVRGKSAHNCRAQFEALHRAGKRPVWLGTGTTWTGMDLSDKACSAEQDLMLTDLIIHRLPVGLNHSLPHERRVAIAGYAIVIQEGLWHFRQGIGRLVRRENVPNRRLWVLDSRLKSTLPWVKGFNDLLARYRS